jgi:hypothetical protein
MVIISPIFRMSIILKKPTKIKARGINKKIIKSKVENVMEEEEATKAEEVIEVATKVEVVNLEEVVHDSNGHYYICLKEDRMSLKFPIKDINKLKFFNICGVNDHSLEYYSIMIEKMGNKRTINLLQTVPRHEVLNSKNMNVIMRFGVGRQEVIPKISIIHLSRKENRYLDPKKE